MAQFTTDLRHISGSDNAPADALSRINTSTIIPSDLTGIDFEAMAKLQQDDQELQAIVSHSDSSGLSLEAFPLNSTGLALTCDISTGSHRPLVPSSMRRQVFDSLHSLSHPGIAATRRLISARFVWPGIKRDVGQWLFEIQMNILGCAPFDVTTQLCAVVNIK